MCPCQDQRPMRWLVSHFSLNNDYLVSDDRDTSLVSQCRPPVHFGLLPSYPSTVLYNSSCLPRSLRAILYFKSSSSEIPYLDLNHFYHSFRRLCSGNKMAPAVTNTSPARSLSPISIAPYPSAAPPVRFSATAIARTMTTPNAIGPTKEWMLPPRPKPGRKLATDRSPNKRKAQNRAAQRAFRERRAARVGELEEQLKETEEERQKREKAMREQIESQNDVISKLEAQAQRFSDEIMAWRERYLQLEKRLAHEEQGKNAVLIKLQHLRNSSAPALSTEVSEGADIGAAPPSRRPGQRPPPIRIPESGHARLCSYNSVASKRPPSPTAQAASKRPRPSIEEADIVTQYAKPSCTAQNLATILNTPLPSQTQAFISFLNRGDMPISTSAASASTSRACSTTAAVTTTAATTINSTFLNLNNPTVTIPPGPHHRPQLRHPNPLPRLPPLSLRTEITPPPSDTDGSPASASASASARLSPITSLRGARKPAAHAFTSRSPPRAPSPLSRPSTAGSVGKTSGVAGATGGRFLDVVVA
jgi:Minimal binding motif of Hap4 for binding to Hap2/3/5